MSHVLVRDGLRRAEHAWESRVVGPLPSADQLATIALHPEETNEALVAGSRPQRFFLDDEGRRYLFKTAPAEHVGAELLASKLRELGKRPRLPTAARVLDLADRGPTPGIIQPVIEHAGDRLPLESREWSATQIELMLQEHPWEWVIGNLDSHIDQYVLVGPERLPFNIDWDHALLDLEDVAPSRHDRRSAAVFPIRNILYDDYTSGRLRLDFWGMQLQARRLQRIDPPAVGALLDAYFEHLAEAGEALPEDRRATMRAVVLRRQRSCAKVFDAFVGELRAERAEELKVGPTRRSALHRAASSMRDVWQGFAIRVVHDRVVRPTLKAKRGVLDMWDRIRRG